MATALLAQIKVYYPLNENTSKDNLNDNKKELGELKIKFENFKNSTREKVNPKITQQVLYAFNLIPLVPLKLLFHLYVPNAEKSEICLWGKFRT